jgi:hypothetical protein
MKRFIGLVMAVAGGGVVLWGGFHVLTGQSAAQIRLTNEFAVSALAAGLVGLLVLTLGLAWARD